MTAGPRRCPIRGLATLNVALLVLTGGLALKAGPLGVGAHGFWLVGLIFLGLPVVGRTLVGHFAADLVAALPIVTAVSLEQPSLPVHPQPALRNPPV